jgi:hypothetical protein
MQDFQLLYACEDKRDIIIDRVTISLTTICNNFDDLLTVGLWPIHLANIDPSLWS